MGYIDKNSDIVISARMTDEGRKLLSSGLLNFNTFRLGDSEIDYKTLGGPSDYNVQLENIIKAKAYNPDIKTPVLPTAFATNSYVTIPSFTPVDLKTYINAPKIGFFQYDSGSTVIEYTAYTDTICHVLQADTIIPISGTTGGTMISIFQAPTYGSNTYEPQVGDLMMVKMTNDQLAVTQNKAVVELNTPVPYLWYKVQNIVSGTLATNNLVIEVDRDFASFPSYTGPNYCWATFYPLGTGTTIYNSNSNKLFSDGGFFSGGCVWNMNNVWSYPIPGVDDDSHETFNSYGSESYVGTKEYFGYTSEIPLTFSANPACHLVPSISLIHYTNTETCDNPSELKYGQKFYVDTTKPESPKLIIPTLMWHKDDGTSIGHVFSASSSGTTQYVTLSGQTVYVPNSNGYEKNISYYNLVDAYENKVGRIYPELHMFSIDDQELVAALSYKSNRNWTLPTLNTDLGVTSNTFGIIDGAEILYLTYLLESSSGYTTGLHCQNIVCVTTENCYCDPTNLKTVEVTIPNELPFMHLSSGDGWYADKFYILAQKTQLNAYPEPEQWKIIDYTANISGHTVGNRIDPFSLINSTFVITNSDYTNAPTYDLSDFIKIPTISESEVLQFGDERFFFGNVEATGLTEKYRTTFNFNIPPSQFNWTTNPTWPGSNQKVHISEVGIYDSNQTLVAIGKINVPIRKGPNTTLIIEVSFDL